MIVVLDFHVAVDLFQIRHRKPRECAVVLHRQIILDRLEIGRRYLGQVRCAVDRESALDFLQLVQVDGSARIVVNREGAFDGLAIGNRICVALAGDVNIARAYDRLERSGLGTTGRGG